MSVRRLLSPPSRSDRRTGRNIIARCVVLLLAGMLVVSCGDDGGVEEDRRFANDPTEEGNAPTVTPTVESDTAEVDDTSGEAEPTAEPALLVDARGAPNGFFSFDDTNIDSITVDGSGASVQTWGAPDGQRFLSIDGAPDLDRIAALVDVNGSRIDLVFYDRTGTELRRLEAVLDVPGLAATPFTDGTGGAPSVDFQASVSWSPLGDAILIGSSRGDLLTLPPDDGEITKFESATSLDGLISAEWSPQGDAIAALIRDRTGIGRLYTFAVDGTSLVGTNLVDLERIPDGNSVEDFAWNANGDRMFFVVADRRDGVETGGQLYSTTIDDQQTRLLVTSGRGGPSGSIGSIVPSPDGNAIAVVITVQDSAGPRFHSLIVRSLEDGSTYEVPTGAVRQIPAVRWVDGGIAWLAPSDNDTAVTIATDDGQVTQLSRTSSSSSASPEASPVDETAPVVRG